MPFKAKYCSTGPHEVAAKKATELKVNLNTVKTAVNVYLALKSFARTPMHPLTESLKSIDW